MNKPARTDLSELSDEELEEMGTRCVNAARRYMQEIGLVPPHIESVTVNLYTGNILRFDMEVEKLPIAAN